MGKDISYIARDYEALEAQLKEYSKQYFPNHFNDFNEYSLESMFLQLNAYIGDVLNFYIDDRYKQNFKDHVYDIESMYRLAKAFGYKPQTVTVAYGEVEFSQIVPAIESEGNHIPDISQTGTVLKDTILTNSSGQAFYYTLDDVNLQEYDRLEINETGSGGVPTSFIIFKTGRVRSGEVKSKTIAVGDYEAYRSVTVDNNVSFILSVVDEEENIWYEVDFLAQDTIFESIKNEYYDNILSQFSDETPYILKPKRVARRFVVNHKSSGECELNFGSGLDSLDNDLEGLSTEDLLTTNSLANLSISENFAIENFLKNDSFGLVPHNTSLTVRYVVGSGEVENAGVNTITRISQGRLKYSDSVESTYRNSLTVTNNEPVSGAGFTNSIEKIRREFPETFFSQRRCVTAQDYMIRTKLLPSKYGSIKKVFVERDHFATDTTKTINIYVLSSDSSGHLTTVNKATKHNLKAYLNEFRMLSDTVNITDAYIINIGVNFEFMARQGYQKDEVALNICRKVEEYFDINQREINQPIVVEELRQKMYEAEGAISISNLDFVNLNSTEDGYSNVSYDVSVSGANFDVSKGVLYPPLDIAIFELKNPTNDITCKHV